MMTAIAAQQASSNVAHKTAAAHRAKYKRIRYGVGKISAAKRMAWASRDAAGDIAEALMKVS